MSEYEQAQRALAETRREAVADLERLRDSLPAGWLRERAATHARMLANPRQFFGDDPLGVTSETIDRWASGWEQHGAGGAS